MNAVPFDKSLFAMVALSHPDGSVTKIFTNASLCVELVHQPAKGKPVSFEYSARQAFEFSEAIAKTSAWLLAGSNGPEPRRKVDEANAAHVCALRSRAGKIVLEQLLGNPASISPSMLQSVEYEAECGRIVALGLVAAAIELITVEANSDGFAG